MKKIMGVQHLLSRLLHLFLIASQVIALSAINRPRHTPPDVCRFEDEKWVSCNHCRCLWAWATWSCTQNVCELQEMIGKTKECYHGDKKKNGCNKCICQFGKWVCDKELCDAECRDGHKIVRECNTCLCIGGKYRCTEYPCITHEDIFCGSNRRKIINCNECICNKTGIGLMCTDMDCS